LNYVNIRSQIILNTAREKVDVFWINIQPTYTKKQKRFGICGSQTGKYQKDDF